MTSYDLPTGVTGIPGKLSIASPTFCPELPSAHLPTGLPAHQLRFPLPRRQAPKALTVTVYGGDELLLIPLRAIAVLCFSGYRPVLPAVQQHHEAITRTAMIGLKWRTTPLLAFRALLLDVKRSLSPRPSPHFPSEDFPHATGVVRAAGTTVGAGIPPPAVPQLALPPIRLPRKGVPCDGIASALNNGVQCASVFAGTGGEKEKKSTDLGRGLPQHHHGGWMGSSSQPVT